MSKEMTAVEYFKAKSRMCDSFLVCCDCPLNEINSTSDINCFNKGFEEEAIAIVQKWAKEHPTKTRQSEFLKMFQNAKKTDDNFLTICPLLVDVNLTKRCARYSTPSEVGACYRCKKDFWLAELPEEVEE